ncbi:MAG: hypothetical protein ACWA5A_02910 [Marinibacterium sp.]
MGNPIRQPNALILVRREVRFIQKLVNVADRIAGGGKALLSAMS